MTNEAYLAYLPQIKKRWENEPKIWQQNRQLAWEAARQIAVMLRKHYAVSQVILFGSLPEKGRFDQHSDIDLAVTGLDPALFYQAVARLSDFSKGFHVDLLDLDRCPTHFREEILEKGISL
jgi:predicted nucleotidyltransferase